MRIEKRGYSRSPWRLITKDGVEVQLSIPFEHPSLGWTIISSSICGDTKSECIQRALDALGYLVRSRQAPADQAEIIADAARYRYIRTHRIGVKWCELYAGGPALDGVIDEMMAPGTLGPFDSAALRARAEMEK